MWLEFRMGSHTVCRFVHLEFSGLYFTHYVIYKEISYEQLNKQPCQLFSVHMRAWLIEFCRCRRLYSTGAFKNQNGPNNQNGPGIIGMDLSFTYSVSPRNKKRHAGVDNSIARMPGTSSKSGRASTISSSMPGQTSKRKFETIKIRRDLQ